MSLANGEVTLNEQPTKSRLSRFCEKKIGQWLQNHATNNTPLAEEIAYRVAFTEEDDVDQISCVTEIRWAGSVWRGCELAPDAQQAFIHSLKRLHATHELVGH
mgnify:CR=1 FL=1